MSPMETIKLEIPVQHLMVIDRLLTDAPYRISAPILHLLRAQAATQQQAKEAPPAPPAVDPQQSDEQAA